MSVLLPALLGLCAALLALHATRAWERARRRTRLLRELRRFAAGAAPEPTAVELLRRAAPEAMHWRGWLAGAGALRRAAAWRLERAGLAWTVRRFVGYSALAGVGGALAGLVLLEPRWTLAAAAACAALPAAYVGHRRARRLRVVEEQLPEAIDLLARAIRAGHSVFNGLRLVAEETPEPLAGEFRRVFDEQKYGMPLEESLLALSRRLDLMDVRVIVVAILVQREIGGNLAEILDKISHLIRTRFQLRRQLRVYTAQGRLSGYVLGFLPLVLGGVIYMINPEYLRPLFQQPAGRLLVGGAIALQAVGYFWIWRILKIEV